MSKIALEYVVVAKGDGPLTLDFYLRITKVHFDILH